MAQLGRISGPLLAENLLRNGTDLAFKNNPTDTPLLYLDTANQRIGINTNSPSSTLDVQNGGIKFTDVTLTDPQDYGNLTIANGSISVVTGNLTIGAASETILPSLHTEDYLFDGNRITSLNSNANLELRPNAAGEIDMVGVVNVTGNLTATGNITVGGNIRFGNDSTVDKVTISGPVASSVVPKFDYLNSIGSASRRYANAHANRVNIETLVLENDLNLPGIQVTLEQGNTFYVSTNGSDTFTGTRVQEPLRTIKAALQAADSSSLGPVMIHVAPGVYDEEFPLELPQNIAISGEEMRNVIIRPTTGTESNDAFLLNDTSTIENITVTGFFYDNIGDTGYAFRFKDATDIVDRSPYIRNCTVITQGTSTPSDDPRGFASGDAGRGALVDGAAINPTSVYASMLFYSVTFITPNANAITVTNGARSELINVFTYFADKAIHLTQGTGRIGLDGSTVEYGAELRIISSASCYGNEGIVADGVDTLAYVINHNFHYIGSGKDKENDTTLQLTGNQIIELNNGVIHYSSIDSAGRYEIGNSFFVDFEQGVTSISGDISFTGIAQIRIVDGFKETIINANEIRQQNVYIIGNEITTIDGDLIFSSPENQQVQIGQNANINGSLTVTGDIAINGSVIRLGDSPTDSIDFNAPFDQDLVPGTDRQNNLGSLGYSWSTLYASQADFEDIFFFDNVITTTQSNSNLELRAAGPGEVMLEDIGVINSTITSNFTQDITLSSITDIVSITSTTGLVIPAGTVAQRTGVPGHLRYNTDENLIEGFTTYNLRLGGLFSDDGRTEVSAGPVVNTIFFRANEVEVGNINADTSFFTRIEIDDTILDGNTISSAVSNSDLELRVPGTGVTYLGTNIGWDDESWINETNSSFTIDITGNGKVTFTDTYGLGMPSGTTAERPSTVESGMTRYNTTEGYLETWNGITWENSIGAGGTITEEELNDLQTIWAIVLG